MSGQGSGGNVLAAICSFFIPGLGQLVQGRILAAILFFMAIFGFIFHVWAIIDAARYKG
jgi:TM2 domain-containing membrane protein YozV